MSTVAETTKEVARPLKVLVPLIQEELTSGDNAGLAYYRRAGEMLLEAKGQMRVGQWSQWLGKHFRLSDRTASRYMLLATKLESGGRRRPFATISEITDPPRANHQPGWYESVHKITNRVNTEALMREEQSRAKEAKLVHDLGFQLIDIGFKVLATKLHPDKGGSSEAMARLSEVRSILRGAL